MLPLDLALKQKLFVSKWIELPYQRVGSSERLNDFNPTVTDKALCEWIDNNPLIDHPAEKIIDNTQSLEAVTDSIIKIT